MGLEDVIKKYQEQAAEEKGTDMRATDYAEEILSITHGGLQSLKEVMHAVDAGWLPMHTLSVIVDEMRSRLAKAREKRGLNPFPF